MTAPRIRILIADDHTLVREGLRSLIGTEQGMEVVGEAANGSEAVRRVELLRPDVILIDLVMPEMDGIEAIARIKQIDVHARILALTSFSDDDKVLSAIKAGALGYLLKDSTPQELLQAIRHVHQGEAFLDPTVALKVIGELTRPSAAPAPDEHALSEREIEVLRLVAEGLSEPGDRREAGRQRAHRAQPRGQHPQQAAPGEPHPGGALRAAPGDRDA